MEPLFSNSRVPLTVKPSSTPKPSDSTNNDVDSEAAHRLSRSGLLTSRLRGLRITFLAGTLGQGGAERQLFYMLRALQAEGAALRLLCLTRGEFWEKRIRALGVPVIWVGEASSRMGRVVRVIKDLVQERPTLVQSSHFYTNLYVAVAGRLLGLPEIGAVRSDVIGESKALGPVLGRICLTAPRWMAANSQSSVRKIVSHGRDPERCLYLPNVVDTAQFTPARHPPTEVVRVLFAGRLGPEKRLDRYLDVLAEVRKQSPLPVRGLVVGDGPLLRTLQEYAGQLGLLPAGVEFRPAAADLTSVYQQADVFLLTSDREGTPNVIMEASASGLPVVATRAGGTSEVVRDGETGFLCECDDKRALASAVARLVADRELRHRLGSNGRAFVQRDHCSNHLAKSLFEAYERILG